MQQQFPKGTPAHLPKQSLANKADETTADSKHKGKEGAKEGDFNYYEEGEDEAATDSLKRRRRKKSSQQMEVLRNSFLMDPKPEKGMLMAIAQETRLTYQEVSRWFRNERHKFKKYKTGLEQKQQGSMHRLPSSQQMRSLRYEKLRGMRYKMRKDNNIFHPELLRGDINQGLARIGLGNSLTSMPSLSAMAMAMGVNN